VPTAHAGNEVMTMTPSITSTIGQRRQIGRFLEDYFQKLREQLENHVANMPRHEAQQFLANGREFRGVLTKTAFASMYSLAACHQFREEERQSTCEYGEGYMPRTPMEQMEILEEFFPEIGPFSIDTLANCALPEGAEGWFVIPDWRSIAATYPEAVRTVLAALAVQRGTPIDGVANGSFAEECLRETEVSTSAFAAMRDVQAKHDTLLVPAQFGFLHRGRSSRRAREVMRFSGQFGLGVFAVGIMLLTHPERLSDRSDLWIDCPGDEYVVERGESSCTPFFSFLCQLGCASCRNNDPRAGWGSASGFFID
jgi:hypothetical protein